MAAASLAKRSRAIMHSLTSSGWSDRCKAGRRVGTKFKDKTTHGRQNRSRRQKATPRAHRGRNPQGSGKGLHERCAACFLSQATGGHSRPDSAQRRRYGRASARERNHDRSFGSRNARGGIHARTAHARPGTEAVEEGRKVPADDRGWLVRLLRGHRRADRRSAAHRAPDDDAVDRSAGAPRARTEALRRLTSPRFPRIAALATSTHAPADTRFVLASIA